jgi:hypothetical protein
MNVVPSAWAAETGAQAKSGHEYAHPTPPGSLSLLQVSINSEEGRDNSPDAFSHLT